MPNRQIAAYALGEVYPPNLAKNMSALQTAGWTTIIIGLFHIDAPTTCRRFGTPGSPLSAAGSLYGNDKKIIDNSQYIGSADWPNRLEQLIKGAGSTVTTWWRRSAGVGPCRISPTSSPSIRATTNLLPARSF